MATPRHSSHALARLLYVHGPDLGAACMGCSALALAVWDYLTWPHGFARFVVAVAAHALAEV